MPALATQEDYELIIGPVAVEDEPRLEYMLEVASFVVVTVAPGLYQWMVWPIDDETGLPVDPGPVPKPAVVITCQVTSRLMSEPEGAAGPVAMERIGVVQTHYDTDWAVSSGLLPAGWQLMLKPWRLPDLASVRLVVPHPSEGSAFWQEDQQHWIVVGDPVP